LAPRKAPGHWAVASASDHVTPATPFANDRPDQ
jgi:hypothetical protein